MHQAQIVRLLVKGRLTLVPQADGYYTFSGAGTVRPPLAGVRTERSTARNDSSIGAPQDDGGRLVFVDTLRVAVIVMVVAHHAAKPYGPTGGGWPVQGPVSSAWLGPFFMVNAAFGMGLLFFLAGYFVARSYDRKGTEGFLRDRFKRIGVPLVRLGHYDVTLRSR